MASLTTEAPSTSVEPESDAVVEAEPQPEASPEPAVEESSKPAAAEPDFLEVRFRAFGTEPFWEAVMSPDGVVYNPMDGATLEFPFQQLRRRAGADIMESSADGRTMYLEVRAESCSDGMSDNEYDYSALLRLDDLELRGCATELASPASEVREDPIGAAGLTQHISEARALYRLKPELTSHVGRLADHDGQETVFWAYENEGSIVMIEERVSRGSEVLSETVYYYDRGLRMVDRNGWTDGSHAWLLAGFDCEPDCLPTPAGVVYRVEDEAAEVPASLVEQIVQRSQELVTAAEALLD